MSNVNFNLPFGKYKGMEFQDTPKSYQDWLLKQDWFKVPSNQLRKISHQHKGLCNQIDWWFRSYDRNSIGGKFKRMYDVFNANKYSVGDGFILEREYANPESIFYVEIINASTGECIYSWTEDSKKALIDCVNFLKELDNSNSIIHEKKESNVI